MSDELEGPWVEHPMSPLKIDPAYRRPGGRPVVYNGKVIRYGCTVSKHSLNPPLTNLRCACVLKRTASPLRSTETARTQALQFLTTATLTLSRDAQEATATFLTPVNSNPHH